MKGVRNRKVALENVEHVRFGGRRKCLKELRYRTVAHWKNIEPARFGEKGRYLERVQYRTLLWKILKLLVSARRLNIWKGYNFETLLWKMLNPNASAIWRDIWKERDIKTLRWKNMNRAYFGELREVFGKITGIKASKSQIVIPWDAHAME